MSFEYGIDYFKDITFFFSDLFGLREIIRTVIIGNAQRDTRSSNSITFLTHVQFLLYCEVLRVTRGVGGQTVMYKFTIIAPARQHHALFKYIA